MNKLFVLLDFDRTLADTNQLKADFDQLLEQGLERQAALAEFSRTHPATDSGQRYLLPGAADLLIFLQQQAREQAIGYGILTYGQVDWQRAKLAATGLLTVPTMITDRTDKGALITSWHQAGSYQLPVELGGGQVERVVLIDDKVYSFEGLPADALGLYCGQDNQAELPVNVQTVSSLSEVQRSIANNNIMRV